MHEYQPYNLLDSEMFTSDDAAYQYQYDNGPVGAQSVLPIQRRNPALEEEGWFEKNKWYVIGGAALVGGAALLYFTRKK
jgi:LPXTG-motif cell wall-anchored protein